MSKVVIKITLFSTAVLFFQKKKKKTAVLLIDDSNLLRSIIIFLTYPLRSHKNYENLLFLRFVVVLKITILQLIPVELGPSGKIF